MKKIKTLTVAAFVLVAATTFQAAFASEPLSPVPGAVCNLYLFDWQNYAKGFEELTSSISTKPAAATFVDSASEFKANGKKDNIKSSCGMWTGWMKQTLSGTYTFTCQSDYFFSIWVNGQKCASAVYGQYSFNVDLDAGFNSIKVIAQGKNGRSLTITYKKSGSLKEPSPFGPENMFYDEEE